jgi:hypothetical protein
LIGSYSKTEVEMKVAKFSVELAVGESFDGDAIQTELAKVAARHGGKLSACVDPVVQDMADNGFKIWAKRVCGVSLAAPRAKVAPLTAEVLETVG